MSDVLPLLATPPDKGLGDTCWRRPEYWLSIEDSPPSSSTVPPRMSPSASSTSTAASITAVTTTSQDRTARHGCRACSSERHVRSVATTEAPTATATPRTFTPSRRERAPRGDGLTRIERRQPRGREGVPVALFCRVRGWHTALSPAAAFQLRDRSVPIPIIRRLSGTR